MKRDVFRMVACLALLCGGMAAQDGQWYKGNTHAHTVNSDGNELPRRVVRWYLDNNYNFLVISDHDCITPIRYLDTDPNDDFILIQGEEVTGSFNHKPVHLNALGLRSPLEHQKGGTLVETLQKNVDAIRAAGAVPQVNHPNWKWSFADAELAQLKGVALFEVLNICLECNNFAAGGYPGMEEIWDRVLSRGICLYGVASDDTHEYLGDFLASRANPGRAWVMVRAPELTAEAILASLEKGDFYATTGVTLADIQVGDREYRLQILPKGDARFTTFFIGQNGRVLKEDYSLTPSYTLTGSESYVRARVTSSTGELALTQPHFSRIKK